MGETVRLLHTSDWHLGRTLHQVDLADAQRGALDFILQAAQEHAVDAIIVAGDVYDRAIPPVDAVRLLHQWLARVSPIVPVIMTSGNHDSATRLGFGAELFHDNLHVRTVVPRLDEPVVLRDEHGPVAVFALPYLDPEIARRELADDEEQVQRSHDAVLSAAMDRVRRACTDGGYTRSVVMAHAFVVGAGGGPMRSDSERDITVGGIDAVSADVFTGATYVALGHLHGPQSVAGPPGTVLQYSGSPIRYSFSEADQGKSLTIVDIDARGSVTTTRIAVPQPRGMARVRGTFEEVTDPEGPYARHADDWVQIRVTNPVYPPDMHSEIRRRFPHALVIQHDPERAVAGGVGRHLGDQMEPKDVVLSFLADMGGRDATEEEIAAVDSLLAAALAGEQ